jgi:hypothetical protein
MKNSVISLARTRVVVVGRYGTSTTRIATGLPSEVVKRISGTRQTGSSRRHSLELVESAAGARIWRGCAVATPMPLGAYGATIHRQVPGVAPRRVAVTDVASPARPAHQSKVVVSVGARSAGHTRSFKRCAIHGHIRIGVHAKRAKIRKRETSSAVGSCRANCREGTAYIRVRSLWRDDGNRGVSRAVVASRTDCRPASAVWTVESCRAWQRNNGGIGAVEGGRAGFA